MMQRLPPADGVQTQCCTWGPGATFWSMLLHQRQLVQLGAEWHADDGSGGIKGWSGDEGPGGWSVAARGTKG
jgi:hypothetical protein